MTLAALSGGHLGDFSSLGMEELHGKARDLVVVGVARARGDTDGGGGRCRMACILLEVSWF